MTLNEIVDSYIREYRDRARAEMRYFEIQRLSFAAKDVEETLFIPFPRL